MEPTTRTTWATIRTAVQVVAALAVAIPVAASTAGLDPALAAKVAGIFGAFVVLATAAMNAIEGKTGKTLAGPPPARPGE